ncbi:unnamed protein product [Psylliodes chrysocephalus]|uniref:Concentrative nucleoside transporter C-terminal domain-containing protein n=1 Tax=Psylliodes chrysocephalus TaxID=3402493 RepID=A0A9P0CGH6_9CUCU|nr:unnamed protein product [Psylliodes chrysocephala]
MNRITVDNDKTLADDDDLMLSDDFAKLIKNKKLLLLDIPEVTAGLSPTEIEIQDYSCSDTANCIAEISSAETLSSCENFYTLTNLDIVPHIDCKIYISNNLSEYEKELDAQCAVTGNHEMEINIVVEDERSQETKENNGDTNFRERTKVIATYAICGFSNPASIGIMISGLGILIPNKRDVITRVVFRACFGGALVCFMTACIAGTVMPDDVI